jgi:hypothetical protein
MQTQKQSNNPKSYPVTGFTRDGTGFYKNAEFKWVIDPIGGEGFILIKRVILKLFKIFFII